MTQPRPPRPWQPPQPIPDRSLVPMALAGGMLGAVLALAGAGVGIFGVLFALEPLQTSAQACSHAQCGEGAGFLALVAVVAAPVVALPVALVASPLAARRTRGWARALIAGAVAGVVVGLGLAAWWHVWFFSGPATPPR